MFGRKFSLVLLLCAALIETGCSNYLARKDPDELLKTASPSAQPEPEKKESKSPFNFFSSKKKDKKPDPEKEKKVLDLMRQGDLYRSKQNLEEARNCYQQVLSFYAENPDVQQSYAPYSSLAIVADMQKRYSEAHALYSQAILLAPDNPDLFGDLGYSFFLSGNLEKAESALVKAIDLRPSDPRYRNNLGLVYGYSGNYEKAYDQFKAAANESSAHLNMSEIFLNQGKMVEAKRSCQMALQADPTSKKANEAMKLVENLEEDPMYLVRQESLRRGGRQMYVEGMESQPTPTLSSNKINGINRQMGINNIGSGRSQTASSPAAQPQYQQSQVPTTVQ